jgi:hypothetical protein
MRGHGRNVLSERWKSVRKYSWKRVRKYSGVEYRLL